LIVFDLATGWNQREMTDSIGFYYTNKKYRIALLENKVVQMTYPYLTVDKMLYLPTISL
jgi:hypothetical protein